MEPLAPLWPNYEELLDRLGKDKAPLVSIPLTFGDETATRIRGLFALNPRPGEAACTIRPVRTEVLTRSGERVPILLTAALVHEGEKPFAAVIIFSDLREKARLEEELNRAEEAGWGVGLVVLFLETLL